MTNTARAIYLAVLLPVAALAWQASAEAQQTRRWGVVTGDPCCGVPPSILKYLDADEACKQEVPLPQSSQCSFYHPGSMISSLGPNPPQGISALEKAWTLPNMSLPPGLQFFTQAVWLGTNGLAHTTDVWRTF